MKRISILLLVLSLFFCLPISCTAKEYRITEQELTQLEENLSRLQTINRQQQVRWKRQEIELIDLKGQLKTAMQENAMQKASLEKANVLLEEYEKEQKKQKRQIKLERNLLFLLVALLII